MKRTQLADYQLPTLLEFPNLALSPSLYVNRTKQIYIYGSHGYVIRVSCSNTHTRLFQYPPTPAAKVSNFLQHSTTLSVWSET
jgi:hypothetical protein